MGSCVSHVKEERPLPVVAPSEPDWSTIKSIIVYGVAKDGTVDGLQWEVIVCINIVMDPERDTRAIVIDLLDRKYYSKTHFTNSLYYQLSTEKNGKNVSCFDTVSSLNNDSLIPTLSFKEVCASYLEDKRMLGTEERLCMYRVTS